MALICLISVIGLIVLSDFVYSRYVAHSISKWEATIERDADGVQKGFGEFAMGDGPTALLMIHGINDSPRCWYKMAPVLAENGFHCRAMRLNGFAETVENYGHATRHEWLSAVDHEIKGLRASHKIVFLVAHSLGGAISIAHVLDNPDSVDGIVLIAPAIEVSDDRSPLFSTRFWHEFANGILIFTRTTRSPYDIDAHDPTERDYEGRIIFTPRSVVDETFALIDNNRGRAGELKLPLMMVLSKDDKVIDWQAAKEFYDEAGSDKKTIFFTKDAGHAIPYDNGWQELADAIAKFAG